MDIRCRTCVLLPLLVSNAFLLGQAQDKSAEKNVSIIAPGTVVGNEEAANWNRVILLATPRIASGDTTKLSESVRATVSKLTLTILATVERETSKDDSGSYRLKEVGVAYSTSIDKKLITISSDSAARLGARLDFTARQMLSENEKQIASLKLVVRTSTLAIFDAPAIMLRDGAHKNFVTRHLIWIDARTGKLALVVWLLQTDNSGRADVAENTLRVIAPGTSEDRRIHVDGRSFFFGIPSERAFALEDLPPGTDVAWSVAARRLATLAAFTSGDLSDFAAALNQMLSGQ